MSITMLQRLLDEDDALVVGSRVTVYWTASGRHYVAPGTVSKVNEKSVRVKLSKYVPTSLDDGYKEGHEICVPRVLKSGTWSWSNCARLDTSEVPH